MAGAQGRLRRPIAPALFGLGMGLRFSARLQYIMMDSYTLQTVCMIPLDSPVVLWLNVVVRETNEKGSVQVSAEEFATTVAVGLSELAEGKVTAEEFLGAVTLGVLLATGIVTEAELWERALGQGITA